MGSGLLQRTQFLPGVSLSSCLAPCSVACTAGRYCWRKQPQETQSDGGEVKKRGKRRRRDWEWEGGGETKRGRGEVE